ncbi:MAG TPA: hypothetical protein VHK69_07275 [Chitinophagaceae bacterium]|nr:hypothetical protein [Chitinophagaceae bacterium]
MLLGLLTWLFVTPRLKKLKPWMSYLSRSFLYALFFGIGTIGGPGSPGFAVPATVLSALLHERRLFLENALVPLLLWWILFLVLLVVKDVLRQKKERPSSPD